MLIKEYSRFKGHLLRTFGLEPPCNVNPHENGEYRLLFWLRHLPEMSRYNCIIDVGANIGDWSQQVINVFAGTNIVRFECIEPIPKFAAKLRSRLSARANVTVHETALGHENGIATIFSAGGGGRMYATYRGGSVLPKPSAKQLTAIKVSVTTGDKLFTSPEFLPYLIKIDCDGHDWHVLSGFRKTLERVRPVVQFEYCDFWIGGQSRLKYACDFLYSLGYATYKMFPDQLIQFKFNDLFETFNYQNIVAAPMEFVFFADRIVSLDWKPLDHRSSASFSRTFPSSP